MLTVEQSFCAEMRGLWPSGVQCTVAIPDERWVSAAAGTKACVSVISGQPRVRIGPGTVRRVTPGTPGTEVRARGTWEFVLEVHISTDNAEEELGVKCGEFFDHFRQGMTYGAYQVKEGARFERVRAQRGGPRVTEMAVLVPVTGPFEVSSEKYEIETVTDESEIEGTEEVGIVMEEGD